MPDTNQTTWEPTPLSECRKCPFCGSGAFLSDNDTREDYPNTWWVECCTCGARGPEQWDNSGPYKTPERTENQCKAEAIASWNRRVA